MRIAISHPRCEPISDHETLFSYYGILLPRSVTQSQMATQITAYLSAMSHIKNGQMRPFVVCRKENVVSFIDYCQFSFSLVMRFPSTNIVNFLPKSRYVYLDFGVYDIFEDIPEVRKAARLLEKKGYFYLGHLVQLTEAELRGFPFINDSILASMKDHLATMKLGLGMAVPAWQQAYDRAFGR